MAFGRSDREDSGGSEGRIGGNRPDCAYFLLLGLCGAAFLLTIGGILTYIAFNPGSIDTRPHSPLSHIPHFHHHRKHHDRTEGHYFGHFEQHNYHHEELKQQQHSNIHHQQPHHPSQSSSSHSNIHTSDVTTEKITTTPAVALPNPTVVAIESNKTKESSAAVSEGGVVKSEENGTTPGNHLGTGHLNDAENKSRESGASSTTSLSAKQQSQNVSGNENGKEKGVNEQQHDRFGLTHRNYNKSNSSSHHHHPLLDPSSSSHHLNQQQQMYPHPGLVSSVTHHEGNNSNGYEYQAKQSLALAIIGPLCLLMGIIVTLVVGVFALKYDCDHEPEPNIAFLRLRSEMSLNFDPSKNNYELLMPASSSSAGVGSTHSIHPGGMPRC